MSDDRRRVDRRIEQPAILKLGGRVVSLDFLRFEEVLRDGEGCEGFEEVGPAGEDDEARQGCEIGEEAGSFLPRFARLAPRRLQDVENGVPGEGKHVEGGERHGELIFAVPEIVFEFVAVVLEDVEAFVFDFPTS